jgi:N-acetylglutamate synthase-like GNAT family acetyltransferase
MSAYHVTVSPLPLCGNRAGVAKPAEETSAVVEKFDEKDFYLDEFRAHTLLVAVSLADCEAADGFAQLGGVLRDLLANDTRVILLLGMPAGPREADAWLRRARQRLQPFALCDQTIELFPSVRGRRTVAESFVDLTGPADDDALARLELIWGVLRRRPFLAGLVSDGERGAVARDLAVQLRVHKLVLVEEAGGVATAQGDLLSFMDDATLTTVLRAGEAEWAGVASRRATLEAVQAALRGGVRAVNLCRLAGLGRELFTYEGSGTLFTLEDYCRVERLGIDDFEQVERLIERGQREGYLKVRSPTEITRILLNGYGATIGVRHLAGVCALEAERYRAERAGEIVGLYTITRFKGEGVGPRLVGRVLADAQALRLRYVFACTTEERAQAFFERQGFRRATADEVPAAKWEGYDAARRARLHVFRREIAALE